MRERVLGVYAVCSLHSTAVIRCAKRQTNETTAGNNLAILLPYERIVLRLAITTATSNRPHVRLSSVSQFINISFVSLD